MKMSTLKTIQTTLHEYWLHGQCSVVSKIALSIFKHKKLIDIPINFSLVCSAPVFIIDYYYIYMEFDHRHEMLFVDLNAKLLIIFIRAIFALIYCWSSNRS